MPKERVGDNMKILVLSDSHRNVANLLTAVEREQPDMVFHLGDLVQDAEELSYACPGLPLFQVTGNCDAWNAPPDVPGTMLKEAGGVRFLLTHGHLFHAKFGPGALLKEGHQRGVDAVLYGHTHQSVAQRQPDGLWLINPGTAGGVGNSATYAVLQVENGTLSAHLKELK